MIRAAGTNCDAEMVRAFELAGARAELVHVDRLITEPRRVQAFDLIGFPGGFSYGDDIASGRVLAVKLREHLYPVLREAARAGVAMIGACNGFQVMVQVGLLPGAEEAEEGASVQKTALTHNSGGRFIDNWVEVEINRSSVCVWTRGVDERFGAMAENGGKDAVRLPIAHGEGRFVTKSREVLEGLESRGQVALRYADDVNGSENRIAGICDPTGRIFGLMPHPERFLEWTMHPYWTRLSATIRQGTTPGLMMFENAVDAVRGAGAATGVRAR